MKQFGRAFFVILPYKTVGIFPYSWYFVPDMKENLFMRAEDDLDFMPIIPLNESDNDGLQDIEIPKELPVLPLRNTVLFPGVVLPITVGRDKSIKAVNDAYKADKLIGVLAQKDSSIEDPGSE